MIQSLGSGAAPGDELLGFRVAVFESDPVLKLTIEASLGRAGARVVPISDDELDAAALGLGSYYSSTVGPIADELLRRGARILFYVGQGDVELAAVRQQWPDIMILSRPVSPAAITNALASLLAHKGTDEGPTSTEPGR